LKHLYFPKPVPAIDICTCDSGNKVANQHTDARNFPSIASYLRV